MALGSGVEIGVEDLPPSLRQPGYVVEQENGSGPSATAGLGDTDLEELERTTIQRVFEQVNGDKALARKMLGISRATLYRKLKRYNIVAIKDAAAAN